jgi:hypothetical protein
MAVHGDLRDLRDFREFSDRCTLRVCVRPRRGSEKLPEVPEVPARLRFTRVALEDLPEAPSHPYPYGGSYF